MITETISEENLDLKSRMGKVETEHSEMKKKTAKEIAELRKMVEDLAG